ncbi:MAG: MBL fold metallo-hydrolase [Desulfobacteraceae bacterium]|nr:MBL fold metallo-hydrolase [Desulfobacteraceae bacterium]
MASEILEDLFFIERGYLNANHFVYRSKSPTLIDTGYIAGLDETIKLLSQLDVNISDVSLIINTHTHCDHIGGNYRIQKESGCGIALHKIGRHFITTNDDWSTWWKYYNQDAKFFNCTKTLEDGDVIAIGPHEFEVIYTPGHASDGIVFYNRSEKLLISSDTLWENDMAVMTLRVEGSAALFRMKDSLKKLESLDVKKVYPGHGRPFTDMNKAITKAKKRIENFTLNREMIGNDLLKKIIIYTLLMNSGWTHTHFFSYLMETYWFKETINLYFNSEYELKYNEIMDSFFKRNMIKIKNNCLFTIVKP